MVNNKTADNTCNATAEFNLFGQSMGTLLRCVVMLQNPNQVINNFIKKIKNSVKICFGRNFSSQNFLVNIIWQPTVLHSSSSYTRTDNQILLLVVTCVPIHSELIKIRNMRR